MKKFLLLFTLFTSIFAFDKALDEKLNKRYNLQEDKLIVDTLTAQDSKTLASKYIELYNLTKTMFYKKLAIKYMIADKNYSDARDVIKSTLRSKLSSRDTIDMYKFLIKISVAKEDVEETLKYAKKLLKYDKSAAMYELLGSLYEYKKDLNHAYTYYDKFFKNSKGSLRATKKITNVLYMKNDIKKGVKYIDKFISSTKCLNSSCMKLQQYYKEKGMVKYLVPFYEKARKFDDKFTVALAITYLYDKKVDEAYNLAKDMKDELMKKEFFIDIYRMKKDFKKSKEFAFEVYQETKDYRYLAIYSEIRMEEAMRNSSDNKIDRITLESIVEDMKRALKHIKSDPYYENFLGYLMIDYNLDVKEGVRLVKKALEKNKNNIYYLDSLLLGYIKLNELNDANKVAMILKKYDIKEKEIMRHLKELEDCLKQKNMAH